MLSVKVMKPSEIGYNLERDLVSIFKDMSSKLGMKHGAFAREVFGDSPSSETKWSRIRKKSQTGKPQALSIRDAYVLANYFGIDLGVLIGGIQKGEKFHTR